MKTYKLSAQVIEDVLKIDKMTEYKVNFTAKQKKIL